MNTFKEIKGKEADGNVQGQLMSPRRSLRKSCFYWGLESPTFFCPQKTPFCIWIFIGLPSSFLELWTPTSLDIILAEVTSDITRHRHVAG